MESQRKAGPVVLSENQACVIAVADARRDVRVSAAVDTFGVLLGVESFSATAAGCRRLVGRLRGWGDLDRVGVEGAGSYGAGLSRLLAGDGVEAVEVVRPGRRARRGHKSDPANAEAAAGAVLSKEASGRPKSADGAVEAIRMLYACRRFAVKARTERRPARRPDAIGRRFAVEARTVAVNQIKALPVAAPEKVSAALRGLGTTALAAACVRLRPDTTTDGAIAAAKRSLRC